MAIPDFQSIMLPLLKLSGDREEHRYRDAIETLAKEFGLTAAEREVMLPSGADKKFDNCVGWALTYLKKALLVGPTRRGYFKITKRGRDLLASNPKRIDMKFLEQFPEYRAWAATRSNVRRLDREVTVTLPETPESDQQPDEESIRESFHIQGLLARIGEQMGFGIWLPRADRASIQREWKPQNGTLLEVLPLNYDEATIKTIERIDVIWLRKRAIVRAFEVEHSTAVYSGLLRMADLLALQPNMDIKLHIVAPESRREKVFQEIQRPVFSFLERAPLSECCKFISYKNVEQLAKEKLLGHLSDSVLDEYSEDAE